MTKTVVLIVLLAVIIALQCIILFELRRPVNARASADVAQLEESLELFREEVLTHLMAEKVEELTAHLESPQDKCIAIGEWLTGNLRNVSQFLPVGYGQDNDGRYALRMGTCGHRSSMMVKMLDLAGIYARNWNMYNFGGRAGGGHSCVQAWYDGDWHFFDPFYGGYFIRDGEVLSWDEIRAAGERAPDYMRVWSRKIDRSRRGSTDPSDWVSISDAWMSRTYAPERIAASRSSGFVRYPGTKTLYATIDARALADRPIRLGERDDEWGDVKRAGVEQKLSERMGCLGNISDYFELCYEFRQTVPGERYRITIHPIKMRNAEPEDFSAVCTGGRILEGEQFDGGSWRITVEADDAACDVTITHDLEDLNQGFFVDQIVIERIS